MVKSSKPLQGLPKCQEREERLKHVNRLERWTENRLPLLGLIATQVAVSVEPTYELLRMCRNEAALFATARSGNRNERLAYYCEHRRMRRDLLRALGVEDCEIEGCELLLRSLSWSARADRSVVSAELAKLTTDEWRAAMSDGASMLKGIWTQHWAELRSDEQDEMANAGWQEFFSVPACQHFFRIAFPCWIFFGKWPPQMLRRATSGGAGSLAALRDLIRLDKEVIHHPRLHDILHPRQSRLRSSRRLLLAKALRSPPPNVSRVKVKYRLARFIYDVAHALGCPLKSPEINELFNIAAGMHGPRLKLSLGPTQPGSFLKGLDREKGHWNLGPKPDKNLPKAVRAPR